MQSNRNDFIRSAGRIILLIFWDHCTWGAA